MGNYVHSRLFNLANQLSHTLDETPQRKTAKLNVQLQQIKAPKENQNHPSFCYYCKEPGNEKRDGYKFKQFRCFQLSNQPFQSPPNSQSWGSEKLQGLFPILLLNQVGEAFLQIGNEFLPVLTDTRATLAVLNPTIIKQSLPWRTETVQISGDL